MSMSGARPLNPARWLGLPLLACVGATVLFAAPLRVWGLQLPEPVFAMVPAFAWALIRPSILAPFAVLVLGLLLDMFWGGPLGLWALSLLIAYAVVLASRNMMTGQSQPIMFAWYVGVTAVAMAAGFLFSMLDSLATPSLLAVFWQFLATVALFPFAYHLVDRFDDADVRFR